MLRDSSYNGASPRLKPDFMRVTAVLRTIAWSLVGLTSVMVMGLSAAFLYLNPQIPDTSTFSEVTLKAPLRIYSDDGLLIQEFG